VKNETWFMLPSDRQRKSLIPDHTGMHRIPLVVALTQHAVPCCSSRMTLIHLACRNSCHDAALSSLFLAMPRVDSRDFSALL
jgi:hypothetical protein